MKKTAQKWFIAIGVAGLLTLAFFWSGGSQKDRDNLAYSSTETPFVQKTASPQPSVKQLEEEHSAKGMDEQDEASAEPAKTDSPAPLIGKKEETAATATPKKGTTENTDPKLIKTTPPPSLKPSPAKPEKTKTDAKPDKNKDSAAKVDQYLTDPIPEGKPKPVEWQDITVDKKESFTATLSVTCKTILNHLKQFNKDKLEVLPADGVIYKTQTVTFYKGETVFDVLLREMKKNKIHMEFTMTPIYNSNYIEGIHNIYEFDCGELSGWMYKVNGWFPNYGSSRYMLKDGDVIDWVYTADLGRDIGGAQTAGGGEK